jgi:hypothetical protein
MLKKIEKFLEITKTAASGLIGIITGYFLKKYLTANAEEKIWVIVVVSITLFFILSFFNWAITKIVDNSKHLRKLLLGKDFLEGCWIQKISDESMQDRPVIYSLIYISYDDGSYKVTGESFDKEGNFTANFISQFSEYSNNILKYPFTITTLENKEKKVFGTSKLTFSSTNEYPNRYLGIVYSNLGEKPVYIKAKKLQAKSTVDLKTKAGRDKFNNLID